MKTLILLMLVFLAGCSQKPGGAAAPDPREARIAALESRLAADESALRALGYGMDSTTSNIESAWVIINGHEKLLVGVVDELKWNSDRAAKKAQADLDETRLKTQLELGLISTNAYENALTDIALGRNPWPATNDRSVFHWGDSASKFIKQ